jgi:hypothetical protein
MARKDTPEPDRSVVVPRLLPGEGAGDPIPEPDDDSPRTDEPRELDDVRVRLLLPASSAFSLSRLSRSRVETRLLLSSFCFLSSSS